MKAQVTLALSGATLLLAACASIPPPTDSLAVARSLVNQAQQMGANQAAPAQLQSARDKLAQADTAMNQHDYGRARALAEEAQVDAQLSMTTARAVNARRAAAEVEQSNRVLGQELQRRP